MLFIRRKKLIVGGSVTRTNRTAGTSAGADGVRSLTAFTPGNNSLLVACFGGVGENGSGDQEGIATVSGGGLTWTKRVSIGVNDQVYTTVRTWATIWTAPVSTGGSTTVGGNANSVADQYSTGLYCYEYNGEHASPIGATGTLTRRDTAGSASFTLSGSPASGSEVIAFAIVNNSTPSLNAIDPGTGWTSQHAAAAVGDYTEDYYEVQTRTGSTSTTVLWNVLDSDVPAVANQGGSVSVALEIKAA